MSALNNQFMQAMQAPNPFGGAGPQMPNMLMGFPGSQGGLGQLVNMFMAQMMPQILGPGMMQMPFQRQNVNMQTIAASMDQMKIRQGAMAVGAVADQQTIQTAAEGFVRTFMNQGQALTPQQREATGLMARDITSALPMMAQIPQLRGAIGEFMGSRGSAVLASMDIAEAARFQIGPGGRMGLAGREVEDLTTRMHREMFAPGRDLSRMGGLRMHEATGAMLEMTRLGMGPQGGIRPENIKNIQRFLEERAPAVKAMQEIFGEMGNPRASMTEIFNGLDALTKGGLRNMSPERVARQVRDIQNLARATGQTVGQFAVDMQTAQQMGTRLGLDPTFDPLATAHSWRTGAAAAARGSIGGHFGGLDRSQFQARISQMAQTGAASPMGQRMAMVAYLGEGGGLTGEAAALSEAVRAGRATFGAQNRNVAEVLINQSDMMRILSEGGADSQRVAQLMTGGRELLQEYGARYNVGALAQAQGQRLEVDVLTTQMYGGSARSVFRRKGMTEQQAQDRSREVGLAATEIMRGLSNEDKNNPSKGIPAIATALRQRFPELTEAEARRIAERGWMRSETGSRQRFNDNLRTMQQLTDPRNAAAAAQLREQVSQTSREQEAVAGLGQTTVMERASDILQEAAGGARLVAGEVVGRLAGGVPVTAIDEARADAISREKFGTSLRNLEQTSPGDAQRIRASLNNTRGNAAAAQPAPGRTPGTTDGPDQGTGTQRQNIQGTLKIEWPPVLAKLIGGLTGGGPRAAG